MSRLCPISVFLTSTLLAGGLSFGFLSAASADVWQTWATWDESYEADYSNWIETKFIEDFFFEGEWGGIATDCADAVYGSRIIFSYLNGLPFSLGPADPKFNNKSTAFDQIQDPKLRVRAFLDSVNDRTWTGSLSRHTYPVALDRASIRPGVIWLKPGHVETVRHIRKTGVVELRGSWLPGAIRKMITISTLGNIPAKSTLGFRRWIWPQNYSIPIKAQAGYSEVQFAESPTPDFALGRSALEQYQKISKFEDRVRSSLAIVKEPKNAHIERMSHDFCALLDARSQVVNLGFDYFSKAQRCLNDKEYDAYSTPSRDANLRRIVFGLGLSLKGNLNLIEDSLKSCRPIAVDETHSISAIDFFRRLLRLDFSSDPHQKPATRFGLAPVDPVCIESGTGDDQDSTVGS